MKTGVWTKSVFKKLPQLAQMVYYSREYEEGKQQQKRTKEKAQALVMAVKTAMNQPERKMPRGTQVKRDDLQLL